MRSFFPGMLVRNSNENKGEDALLAIFETWRALDNDSHHPTQPPLSEWHSLTHVCRSWRHVIHGHARHLGLRLSFTRGMPVKEMLDSLPPWPIALNYDWSLRSSLRATNEDGILRALQYLSRPQEVSLHSNPDDSLLEQFVVGMMEPLPSLELLRLRSGENRTTLPATPAGYSTLDLQTLLLDGFAFHSIPPFLVPATGLKHIDLRNIYAIRSFHISGPCRLFILLNAVRSPSSLLRVTPRTHGGFCSIRARLRRFPLLSS
ncbi:hypothetical protein BC834DRAFT_282170 [Gloeopeniophorella convolvens]|nr:hypothetical protein BC834DRAFT_282170 [Gloeopeniophorella convolvens]